MHFKDQLTKTPYLLLFIFFSVLTCGVLSPQLVDADPTNGTLYSVRGSFDSDDKLRIINQLTGMTISNVTITLPGESIQAGTGLATHPITNIIYAILKISGQDGRELVTINPITGVASSIGDTGRFFSAIAFDETGKLYGVTGAKDVIDGKADTLFEISLANGSTTFTCPIGVKGEGHALAFNPNDNLFYHISFDGLGDQIFEKFDPDLFACDTTTIDRTLPNDYGQVTGLAFWESQDAFLRTGFTGDDFQSPDSSFLWKVPANGSAPTKIAPIVNEIPFPPFTGASILPNLALVTNGTETLYSLNQNFVDSRASVLLVVNITDASIISSTPVLLNGVTNGTALALASDSLGTLWAIIDPDDSFADLTTLDTTSSPVVATVIGNNAGGDLADIAFDDSDNLYALDEENSLYAVNKVTGIRSFVCTLGGFVPDDNLGGYISFNSLDDLMYHESSEFDFDLQETNTNFEKFDIDSFSCNIATQVGIPTEHDEPLALTFWKSGNVFIFSHLDAPTLANVTEAGQLTTLGTLDHTAKGLTFVEGPQNVTDSDGDGVLDGDDNCPNQPNPLQENLDGDSLGDTCDPSNIITSSKTISTNHTLISSLTVPNGILLIVPSGLLLTIPNGFALIVESGGGVLIEFGGGLFVLIN